MNDTSIRTMWVLAWTVAVIVGFAGVVLLGRAIA